jgi:hypothetical protein
MSSAHYISIFVCEQFLAVLGIGSLCMRGVREEYAPVFMVLCNGQSVPSDSKWLEIACS